MTETVPEHSEDDVYCILSPNTAPDGGLCPEGCAGRKFCANILSIYHNAQLDMQHLKTPLSTNPNKISEIKIIKELAKQFRKSDDPPVCLR